MADPPLVPPSPADPPSRQLSPLGWCIIGATALFSFVAAAALGTHAYRWIDGVMREDRAGLNTTAQREQGRAALDHATIVDLAAHCTPQSTLPIIEVSHRLLTVAPNGPGADVTAFPYPEPGRRVQLNTPSYLLAVLTLSNDIARSRVEIANQSVRDYVAMQVFQWALVIVGAITTVLIGIKSTSTVRSHAYLAIGIAAIIASSLGTALATLNSFYTPRLTYQRSSHTLASLRSLHVKLVESVTRQGGVCDTLGWPKDWKYTRIRAMADQYAAIIDAAQADTSADPAPPGPEGSDPGADPVGKGGSAMTHAPTSAGAHQGGG